MFWLLASQHALVRGNPAKARSRLDRATATSSDLFDFMPAYDARIMLREGRYAEADARMRDAIARLPDDKDADQEYVYLYCQLFLAIGDESFEYRQLRKLLNSAQRLKVGSPRHFLPLASADKLLEICGHRDLARAASKQPDGLVKPSSSEVRFDWN